MAKLNELMINEMINDLNPYNVIILNLKLNNSDIQSLDHVEVKLK